MSKKVGFAVIFRWRLHAGKEQQFRQAWERGTLLLMTNRGGLGSRLHQVEDWDLGGLRAVAEQGNLGAGARLGKCRR
jgi:hypothetical protein